MNYDPHTAFIRCLESGDPESALVYWRSLVKRGHEAKARRMLAAAVKLAQEVLA